MAPHSSQTHRRALGARRVAIGSMGVVVALALGLGAPAPARAEAPPGTAGAPYAGMPALAPIGVRPDHYLPLPKEVAGPPIDPAKGYRLQELGRGLYMVTDNAYQSMFLVHE